METIDVRGLPEELARQLKQLVDLLKENKTLQKAQDISPTKEEKIEFGSFPLGVKGTVTREEIYDYL